MDVINIVFAPSDLPSTPGQAVDTFQTHVLDVVFEGTPGPPGSGTNFQATSATALSGHRVVKAVPAGVAYASNNDQAMAFTDLWLTENSSEAGQPVNLLTFGEIFESSWSWELNKPVYLGANGVLTQTSPVSGVIRQLATVVNAKTLFYNPRPALVLA